MLTRHLPYHDLGADYFDHKTRTRTVNRLLKRLNDLGIQVIDTRIITPSPTEVSL
jgi:hypothetical protein